MSESAVEMAMTGEPARNATFRELADRADRARAQAVANCEILERALSQTRAFVPTVVTRYVKPADGYAAAESRIRELQETVDGLLRRLESQGPIEQAKGIIMAQTHCTADQAFEILRRASQRSNTKLRLLAVDLVERTSRAKAGH